MTEMTPGTERVRPSSLYYLLALASIAAAIALIPYFLITNVRQIRENMVRMNVPGELDLDLKRLETYTVFVEFPRPSNGAALSKKDLSDLGTLRCEVQLEPAGTSVGGQEMVGRSTYNSDNYAGVSILDFEVPHDGTYSVNCQGPSEISGQKVQVAVGGDSAKSLKAVKGRCFVSVTGGFVIGVLILVRVAMLRLESRRDIRERGLQPV